MRFLLDTNAAVALLRWRGCGSMRRGTSACRRSSRTSCLRRLSQQAAGGEPGAGGGLRFEVVAFDAEDARAAGAVRAALAAAGTPIGPYDALIAGQALARGLVLVTHNPHEFARVEGLRVEDWE